MIRFRTQLPASRSICLLAALAVVGCDDDGTSGAETPSAEDESGREDGDSASEDADADADADADGSGDGDGDGDSEDGSSSAADGDGDGEAESGDDPLATWDEVAPVFMESCDCHGGHTHPGDGDFRIYDGDDGTRHEDVFDAANQLDSMKRIEPGDPEASYILHKVRGTHEDVGGSGDIMPEKTPLDDEAVELIEAWIRGGAPK